MVSVFGLRLFGGVWAQPERTRPPPNADEERRATLRARQTLSPGEKQRPQRPNGRIFNRIELSDAFIIIQTDPRRAKVLFELRGNSRSTQ